MISVIRMSGAPRPFRFGVNMFTVDDAASWTSRARHVEDLGYDVLLFPDHLGAPSPWPALSVAATATQRLRLGTFVLNAAFTNPALLARDVATVDRLSGGRVELGLGTGYAKNEFEAAGIDFGTPGRRVDHLSSTVRKVASALDDPGVEPRPVQARVPLMVAGNGDRVLRVAAEHADIVAFTAARTSRDGELRLLTADDFESRVAFARRAAGARVPDIEWNLLVQVVALTDDPESVFERTPGATEAAGSAEAFAELPTVLVGSTAEIAERLVGLRARTGISYISVHEPALEEFAPIIPLLRAADA